MLSQLHEEAMLTLGVYWVGRKFGTTETADKMGNSTKKTELN